MHKYILNEILTIITIIPYILQGDTEVCADISVYLGPDSI